MKLWTVIVSFQLVLTNYSPIYNKVYWTITNEIISWSTTCFAEFLYPEILFIQLVLPLYLRWTLSVNYLKTHLNSQYVSLTAVPLWLLQLRVSLRQVLWCAYYARAGYVAPVVITAENLPQSTLRPSEVLQIAAATKIMRCFRPV